MSRLKPQKERLEIDYERIFTLEKPMYMAYINSIINFLSKYKNFLLEEDV